MSIDRPVFPYYLNHRHRGYQQYPFLVEETNSYFKSRNHYKINSLRCHMTFLFINQQIMHWFCGLNTFLKKRLITGQKRRMTGRLEWAYTRNIKTQ